MVTYGNSNFAPIVLFCYRRPEHLKRTVEALQGNVGAADSRLIVFSDGARSESDRPAVEAVRAYLPSISGFRDVEIRKAEKNMGLAASIIAGVTEIVNQYGKIIVLEDDLVTAPYFLKFMNDALCLYEYDDLVAGIHGYCPIQIPEGQCSFFTHEVGCWGWATWKRGWEVFEPDGRKLLKQLDSRAIRRKFNVENSYPFYKMLKNQVQGRVDSWAIRWYASVFLAGKLGLQSGRNLVSNIGYSDGEHYSVECTEEAEELYKMPIELQRIDLDADEELLRTSYAAYFYSLDADPAFWRRIWRWLKKTF